MNECQAALFDQSDQPAGQQRQRKESRWNRYRVWKPLSLMVLAGLTPPEWEVVIVDENLGVPDYPAMPRPDLVGITAFTSQAPRAYEVAACFRRLGVPVVMGGIHATMCVEEVLAQVDSVVTREAEGIWPQVLADARQGGLKRQYDGGFAKISEFAPARHDLLPARYAFGAIQTTRGCPLNCTFCSVTTFNGAQYRQRPIPDVVREFQAIREKRVLVVDDNLIGTRPEHIARAKDLFRALAHANLRKQWIAQATINFADDEELLTLAAKAGCRGVFIGFESPSPEGLRELGKKFNLLKGRDFRASVRRIQRHGILVVGSFIIGLDIDEPGIGQRIAEAASRYGVDHLNALFLTPLPGTRLWDQMKSEDRIALTAFPEDMEILHPDLPGRPVQALVAGRRHPGNDRLQSELLFPAAPAAPGVGQLVAAPQAPGQPGGQSVLPPQQPRGLRDLRGVPASVARFFRDKPNANQGLNEYER